VTRIARYIDDPPQIFFWEVDEIVIFSTFFALGMLADTLTVMIFLGIGVAILFSKVKQNRSDGFFLHVLYWLGIFGMKGCPPSHMRTFYE